MELEGALELNRNLKSLIQEMDLEDHLTRSHTSSRFRSWDQLCFRCDSNQHQKVPDTSVLWYLDIQI